MSSMMPTARVGHGIVDIYTHWVPRDPLLVSDCSGGLLLRVDGAVAGCTLDDDIDGCEGLEERRRAPRRASPRRATAAAAGRPA
jgi:hypothetical protein